MLFFDHYHFNKSCLSIQPTKINQINWISLKNLSYKLQANFQRGLRVDE
jgi:hypothetical protein